VFFTAAVQNSSIISLLPEYAMRHHTFFRDKYPHLFPEVALIRSKTVGQSRSSHLGTSCPDSNNTLEEGAAIRFFEKSVQLFDDINNSIAQQKFEAAENWIRSCARLIPLTVPLFFFIAFCFMFTYCTHTLPTTYRDLKRVSQIDASLKPKTEFYRIYLRCLRIMLQVLICMIACEYACNR